MGNRETLSCLAVAIVLALAGCQASGTGENGSTEQGSWWNWGKKTPPPSTTSGSPFSAAATYNRQNTSETGMGLTVYDGSAHAKPASPPPATLPANAPCTNAVPPVTPGATVHLVVRYTRTLGRLRFPAAAHLPGMIGAAPTGYWVYQPANGPPVANNNGVPLCIPVYGQAANVNSGYGASLPNGNPAVPSNMAAYPVQAGPCPMNYPQNSPAMTSVNGPVNGGSPLPPNVAAGVQPANAQAIAPRPSAIFREMARPNTRRGGYLTVPPPASAPVPANQGAAAFPYVPPQTPGSGPAQVQTGFDPSHSAAVPVPATNLPR